MSWSQTWSLSLGTDGPFSSPPWREDFLFKITRLWRAVTTVASLSLLTFSAAEAADDSSATAAPRYGAWGYDLRAQDPLVKPGTDFYPFANSNWLRRTEITVNKFWFGNFDKLNDLSDAIIRKLIEDATAGRAMILTPPRLAPPIARSWMKRLSSN
jgi:hypothetical protein